MAWLISQSLMNSLCLQGQEEASLVENCSDGEQSVLSNGNPIQQAYCAPDKMTVFSRLSRFGMMYRPLTADRGEELLTLYLAGFHAKTFPQQERAQELTENGQECGKRWHGLLAKYDQDSCSWKTPQCSLLGDSELYSETWPRWGLMRNGECWEQQTLGQTIRGTESGLSEKWATPTTMDMLPPKSEKALMNEATNVRPGRSKPANLRDQVSNMEKWPTPRCHMTRTVQVRLDVDKGHKSNLEEVVAVRATYPTTTCHNSKECAYPSEYNRKTPTLATHAGGKLNPTWVEWLMGWPLGWTDLKPLEMGKCPYAQLQPGEY